MNNVQRGLIFFAASVVLAFSSQNGFAESGLTGKVAWAKTYNGPDQRDDSATAGAVVDSRNNVYVAGRSQNRWDGNPGGEWDYDIAVVKYDPDGKVVWTRRYSAGHTYEAAYAMAIDKNDNIYVAGVTNAENYGGQGGDFIVIKYNSAGTTLWQKTYDGPTHTGDTAYSVAVDNDGSVYVTGQSDVGGDNIYAGDYATVKFNSVGQMLWAANYNPADRVDTAHVVDVDEAGNVYVTGVSYNDCTTIRYNPVDGSQVWVSRYDGPGNKNDSAFDMAIDQQGFPYVTGKSWGTSYDYLTIKYNPANGEPVWVARYNGPANDYDIAHGITIDSQGYPYVTGESKATTDDYLTIKYNPINGEELWVVRHDGPISNMDWASDITTDKNDNVYVTGHSTGASAATVKYNPVNGEQVWVARYNGVVENAYSIVTDNLNNIIVAGESAGNGASHDFGTIKYLEVPTVTVEVEPLTPIVERGGQAQYTVKLTNNSIEETEVVEFWSRIKDSDGEWRDAIDPTSVTLESREIRKKTITEHVPLRSPVGDYEYHGFVGPEFDQIWDEAVANFTVTDPRLNF
ncbi:MAG: SBBP repeat-containing protein [Planctomycetes bacterium]|nr:SBBP repeat-containing protein [Planctomycetota bacterium]